MLGRLKLSFWIAALGVVALYVFFVSVAGVPPRELGAVSVVVGALALLVTVHNLRVENELADPGGDPRLRRALNRQRERRGF